MRPPYQKPPAALIAKIRRYIAEHLQDAADHLADEPHEILRRTPPLFEGEQRRRDLHHGRPPKEAGGAFPAVVMGAGIFLPSHLGSLFSRLKSKLNKVDETFSERLLRLIDESGMTDVEAYKRAGVDRKLFSKIRKDKHYQPGYRLVYAFIFALRLNIDTARDLLASAGYTISHARRFDIIMEVCIKDGCDIDTVNNVLYEMGLEVLCGAKS